MSSMLARAFGHDAGVRYVNLGDVVDLSDPALSFDRMHLTMAGNDRIAAALADPVRRMSHERTP
jgi:lysophospholipase L1-like esterase